MLDDVLERADFDEHKVTSHEKQKFDKKKHEQPDTEKSVDVVNQYITLCDVMLGLIAEICFPPEKTISESVEEVFLSDYLFDVADTRTWDERIIHICQNPTLQDNNLLRIASYLNLCNIELMVVSLLLGVEQNAMIGRCIAYLQSPIGGSRPTLGLLDSILQPVNPEGNDVASVLVSGNATSSGLVLLLNEFAPLPEQTVRIPVPLSIALKGFNTQWPGSRTKIRKKIELPISVLEKSNSFGQSLVKAGNRVLVIRSTSVTETECIANEVVRSISKKPLYLSTVFLSNSFVNNATLNKDVNELKGLSPFCFLGHFIPVFEFDSAPGEHILLPEIPNYEGPVIIIAGHDGTFEYPKGSVVNWSLSNPDIYERISLWGKYFPNSNQWKTIADENIHGTNRIAELAQVAIRQANLENRDEPNENDLRNAALVSEGTGLGALAQLIPGRVSDDALVLRKSVKDELELLLSRCRHRESLSEGLGVTLSSRYQSGVRSLFVGPSGTGKTLVGSWLATKLNLPLYRVDLASVTSKYIGETEKNLSKLLNKAEQEEVVLLFDEADSMFGKRTDIQDSNDRFANAQTNYLLQRIESYSGIVLLTSNSRTRFDAAFTRRIDMIVEFLVPQPEERRDLWRCHIGNNHNLSVREINQLSTTAELCGGHIRNVVLTAAIIAQTDKRKIKFDDLVFGISAEYKKMGKKLPVELTKRTE